MFVVLIGKPCEKRTSFSRPVERNLHSVSEDLLQEADPGFVTHVGIEMQTTLTMQTSGLNDHPARFGPKSVLLDHCGKHSGFDDPNVVHL